jgi:hypothetical protein
MNSRGIVFIVFGKEYDRLASYTVTLSAPNVNIPITVITNIKIFDSNLVSLLPRSKVVKGARWSHVPNINFIYLDMPDEANREVKTQLYKYSPYEETIHIDCDSIVTKPGIEKVFDHFNGNDLILQSNGTPTWEIGKRYFKIYRDAAKKFGCTLPWNIYQGAFFSFRKSEATIAFFDLWNKYWKENGSGRDMPALACAVQNSKIQHSIITANDHKFFAFSDIKDAIVIHPTSMTRLALRFKTPMFRPYREFDKNFNEDWKSVPFDEVKKPKKTIAIIRLHSYNENPSMVWDAIGEYCSEIYFVANNVTDQAIIEAAKKHPLCAGIRIFDCEWDNHESLVECYKWADEIKPDYILMFDEDEIPPVRFSEVLEQWKKSGSSELLFKCIWCYGDTNTILKDYHIPFGFHMKACRWKEGMWKSGVGNKCRLKIYEREIPFRSQYPYKHLSVMTKGLRDVRTKRYLTPPVKSTPTMNRICRDDLKTIPYDPDMVYDAWMKQAEKFEKKHQYD